MAKITRVFQKLFGSTGDTADFGQFGSLAAASPVTTKSASTIQGLAAFLEGWTAAVLTVGSQPQVPALEDLNGLFLVAFQQLAYLFQEGMPEWDPDTVYYTNSFCQVNGVMYKSLIDNNTNLNPTTNPSDWELAIIPPDSPFITGEIKMWAGATGSPPSGFLICDGSILLRASYPALFTAIGTTYGSTDSTNFLIPDFRGVYPKGAGTTTRSLGVDASGNHYSATLGAYSQDQMQGHIHTINVNSGAAGSGTSGGDSGAKNTSSPVSDGTNGTPRTGHTTEPQNLGINFIIKT